MLHAVIMAGGSGTRLWPESTPERPKQFLAFQNDTPMIRACYNSLSGIVDRSRIHIVTNRDFVPLVRKAIPAVPRKNIILEPFSRNTAPCIALAAITLLKNDPKATMIVLPSDHIIEPVDSFRDTLRIAVDLVEESPERLATLGIKPNFPSTDYGYVETGFQFERRLSDYWMKKHAISTRDSWHVCEVKKFTEKPDLTKAKDFVSSGRYLWNSGIFVWKARQILKLIRKFQPEMGQKFKILQQSITNPKFSSILETVYELLESVSIDYAVLEHAQDVVCVKAPFKWNDMGNWTGLKQLDDTKKDHFDNYSNRCQLFTRRSKSNIVRSTHPDQKITLIGVKNLIIVQTEDGLLVVNDKHQDEIPKYVSKINKKKNVHKNRGDCP